MLTGLSRPDNNGKYWDLNLSKSVPSVLTLSAVNYFADVQIEILPFYPPPPALSLIASHFGDYGNC